MFMSYKPFKTLNMKIWKLYSWKVYRKRMLLPSLLLIVSLEIKSRIRQFLWNSHLWCSVSMLSSVIPPGRDKDTMMSNIRLFQSFQVCSFVFTAYKAYFGMDVARKAASLGTAIPSSASCYCVNFMPSVNYY